MSVFLTNNELQAFAKNGISGLAIKNTVDAYRSQGLSDDDIRAKIDAKLTDFAKAQYGAENVEKARAAVKETAENLPSNTLVDNLLTKEALVEGAKGGLVFGERMLNGATLGAYDWANEKLGGNAKGRLADVQAEADRAGLGTPLKAVMIGGDVLGGVASPIAKGVMGAGKIAKNIPNQFLNKTAQGIIGGSAIGGVRGAFDSDFDAAETAKSALIGGAVGGAIPASQEGWQAGTRLAKNIVSKGKTAIDKMTHGAFSPSAEEMAAGAQEIAGAMADNGELAGSAVKNLADEVLSAVRGKAKVLYDKAEQLAAGRPVVLDKNSNFAQAFNKIAGDVTKSGRSELNKIWNEVGHSKFDAPTYETAKAYRSLLSEKSATGGTGLTKKQYGDLLEALDRDIESSLGKEAAAAKKAADAFYRSEMGNPDSITNSVNKLLRNDPVSVVGNRSIASAQGKAWKASPLQKLINEGEKLGSSHVADVKQALQANTTTRAQFNRMSQGQKEMVYGDKLPLAEKNFNSGLTNWLEKQTNKTIDIVSTPIQKVLDSLTTIPTVQGVYQFTPKTQNTIDPRLFRALKGQ